MADRRKQRLGQGKNNSKAFLAETPQVADEIEGKIYAALGIERSTGPKPATASPEDEAAEAKAPRGKAEAAEKKAA